ncbi:hypothetical protein [Magnetospirillum fulvum]|uniref:hypothetical protein n=1 Tax=Magnetospirillum fulvum TaxID=1082 RepID=UPI0012DED2FD|nr:hypothetical protein [Magnetospirillum fulvum]
MKQVFERSLGFVILISIVFLSGSAFADSLFGNSSIEEASSIIKDKLIKLVSTVLPYIIFIFLLRTTIGFVWFVAIVVFNFYEKIGFFWSSLASVFLYIIILGFFELIFGKGKIKENKKKTEAAP